MQVRHALRWPPGATAAAHAAGIRPPPSPRRRDDAFIDSLFTDISGEVWYYRRQPDVTWRMARAELRAGGGLPDVAPELPLPFRSKNGTGRERSQDQADFDRACPCLEP